MIAIIQLNRLGDILQTSGLILRLRGSFPERQVNLIIAQEFISAMQYIFPDIRFIGLPSDFIVALQKNQLDTATISKFVQTHPDLNRHFAEVINVNHDAGSAQLAFFISADKKFGRIFQENFPFYFAEDWSAYMVASTQERTANIFHMQDLYSAIRFGNYLPVVEPPMFQQSVSNQETKFFNLKKSKNNKLIVLHTRANSPQRMWPEEYFFSLIRRLERDPANILALTGSQQDREILDQLIHKNGSRAINLAGQTNWIELRELIASADLFITNDTGPSHLAAMTTTPILSIHLSTAYIFETFPYSEKNTGIYAGLNCYPCHPGTICKDLSCLTEIDVDTIYGFAQNMLSSTPLPRQSDRNSCFAVRGKLSSNGFLTYLPFQSRISNHLAKGLLHRMVWNNIFNIEPDTNELEILSTIMTSSSEFTGLKMSLLKNLEQFKHYYEQARELCYELVVNPTNSERQRQLLQQDEALRNFPDSALKFFHIFVQARMIERGIPHMYHSLLQFYSRMEQAIAASIQFIETF